MSTTDILWRLAESYGVLLGMGLGSTVIIAVVIIISWRHEVRWSEAFLGLGSMALIAFSLWIVHDLDLTNRKAIQPKIDHWLTRLTAIVTNHHHVLSESVCQPKIIVMRTAEDVQGLAGQAVTISMLVDAIKTELGSLLPSNNEGSR